MKKRILCIFCLTILTLLPAAALGAERAPAYGRNRGKAGLLTEANMAKRYIIDGKYDGIWYKFECDEDDTWFLAVECTGRSSMYYTVVDGFDCYKSNVEQGDLKKINVLPDTFSISSFEVLRGETVYLCFGHSWQTEYQFSLCSSKHHDAGMLQKETKAPACTEPGKLAAYCTLCNQPCEYTDIPALGHQPGEWKSEPAVDCEQSGRFAQYCSRCGKELAVESIPPAGHRTGEAMIAREATCLTAGLRVTQCTACHKVLSSEKLPITGHRGKWVETLKATCTADGLREEKCETCGKVLQNEIIPARGHQSGEWKTVREAACLQSGLREKSCIVCGVVLENEIQPALGHRYTEWKILTEATKQHEGERRRHCEGCGDTQYEMIPKIPKFLGIF